MRKIKIPSKMIFRILFPLLCLCPVLGVSGCGNSNHGLVIAGSTSVQPVMEKIVETYKKAHPGVKINVEGGGSSAGVMATLTGTAQLGMASRELKTNDEKERQLTAHKIAFDAVIVIVNTANPVKNLSIEQIRKIFSGTFKTWKEVGGLDDPIHLIVREEGSGTRSAFDEMVMKDGKTEISIDRFALVQDSMGGTREVVRGDPDAIGFISLGGASPLIKVLDVEGITPDFESVKSGKYKLIRPFLILSKGPPGGIAKDILGYVLSSATTEIMRKEGLLHAAR